MEVIPLLVALVAMSPQTQQPRPRWYREPKTYHVSLQGDDANDGSNAKPFRTVQHGVDALKPGDILNIAAGIYKETVTMHHSGGYFDRDLHISGQGAILDGTGLPEAKGTFDTNGCDYLDIRGLTVRNGGYVGFEIQGSWRIKLTNCKAIDVHASGIHIDKSQNVEVDSCEVTQACHVGEESVSIKRSANILFQNSWIHDTGHEGIDVKEGSRHVRILHNRLDHVERQALYADAWDSDTFDIRFDGNVMHDCMMGMACCTESGGLLHDVWYVNNVVYDCQGPGMILARWGNEGMEHRIRDVVFANNTVVNCGNGGKDKAWGGGMLLENDQAENVQVLNNVLSANPQGQILINRKLVPRNMTICNNLLDGRTDCDGRGNLFAPAGFIDPAKHDYRLTDNGLGIDRGAKSSWSGPIDAAGRPRVQGRAIDIGAYENR